MTAPVGLFSYLNGDTTYWGQMMAAATLMSVPPMLLYFLVSGGSSPAEPQAQSRAERGIMMAGKISPDEFFHGGRGTASASVLAACTGGGASGPAQPAASSRPQLPRQPPPAAAATPAAAANPLKYPVLVWQELDYIPQTTQGPRSL